MPFETDASAPTSQEIFDSSKVKWGPLGYSDAGQIDDLTEDSIGYVTWITGRYFSDFVPVGNAENFDSAVYSAFTPVPLVGTPHLIRLARRAVRMRVEQEAYQDQPGYIDTASDDVIQSFTAGAYSETRRDTSTLRGGRQAQRLLLNSSPSLNDLLMQLMTDERRDYWNTVLGGGYLPAFMVEEVDWSLVGKTPIYPSLAGDPASPLPSMGAMWWE